jgi:ABC-type dipeptide/oligopeptide/nickel transport system permease subunit
MALKQSSSTWMPYDISLAVLGFNLFGDALRDARDPKLRRMN